ncbi:hypothetical protein HQ529_03950 [Candidatus Woesearchaeota archaeon]|nr:hypothetical protein [Candidatus Woesearchaeota archaeon]
MKKIILVLAIITILSISVYGGTTASTDGDGGTGDITLPFDPPVIVPINITTGPAWNDATTGIVFTPRNVGVGTITPDNKLHIYGGDFKVTATDDDGANIYAVDNNGYAVDFFAQNGKGYLKTTEVSMDLVLGAGYWGDHLIIKPNGNVGIGIGNPGAKLHIYGDNKGLIIQDTTNDGGRPFIRFVGNDLNVIESDDTANEIFGVYSKFSSSRENDAIVKIFGDTQGEPSWGRFLQLTHNGEDGRITTDVGDIILTPASGNGNVNIQGDIVLEGGAKIVTNSEDFIIRLP